MAGGRNHAEGALAAAEFRVLLDAVDRNFAGAAENRKYRAVFQEIDCVITPLAGGDLAAIKAKDAVELAPAESHFACGGVRTLLAPAPPAWIDLAEVHAAPPSVTRASRSLHDRARTDHGQAFLRGVLGVKNCAVGRLSEAPLKRIPQSRCGIFERLNHAFVRRIIMQPHFGQAHAKLTRQLPDCCLRARFGSRSGFLSPPAPRGVDGPGQEFRAKRFELRVLSQEF